MDKDRLLWLRKMIRSQQDRMRGEQQHQLEPAWKEAVNQMKERNDPTLVASLLWRVISEGDGFTKIPSQAIYELASKVLREMVYIRQLRKGGVSPANAAPPAGEPIRHCHC